MAFLDEIGKIGAPLFGDQISSFLHPERGYEAAMDELRKYWEEASGYLKPYQQHGLDQYGILRSGISELINPANLMSKFISGYETSPYAKQLMEQSRQQGLDAASSMGLMGSSAALGNLQKGASDIVSRDRQQYINDLMNTYLSGLGLSSNIYGTGASAAGNLMRGATGMGENIAGMAFNRANAPGSLLERLLGLGMQGMKAFGGGGGGFLG